MRVFGQQAGWHVFRINGPFLYFMLSRPSALRYSVWQSMMYTGRREDLRAVPGIRRAEGYRGRCTGEYSIQRRGHLAWGTKLPLTSPVKVDLRSMRPRALLLVARLCQQQR